MKLPTKIPVSPRADENLAQATLDSIGDAVLSTDTAGNVVYLNSVAEKLTGWPRSEAKGRPLDEVFRVIDGVTRNPSSRDPMGQAVEQDEAACLPANTVLIRRDGTEFAIEDSIAPIHDRNGSVVGAVMVFRDVSKAREAAHRMTHLAQYDFLTDLPNAILLNDRINQAIALARRYDKQCAVLFMDLDQFKLINNTLGHAAGDELLQSIARRLKACVRRSDAVSRKGGDEFVVLLSEMTHADHAARSADKIITAVTAPHRISGRDLRVAASIGIAIYPIDGADAGELLKSADSAMYQAKRNGGGQYWFYSREMDADASSDASETGMHSG